MNVLVLYINKSSLNKIHNFVENLNDKVHFKYLNYNIFFKKNLFLKNKFSNFIINNKPDIIFDLLPIPVTSLNNTKYLKLITKIHKIRKIIKTNNIKTLKVSHSWLNKYDVAPHKYFLYLRNLFFYLKNFFVKDIYKFNKTNFTILTGTNCENNEKFFNTKKIYFKHFDNFLKKKNLKKKIHKNLVYIDQFLHAHPDLVINGLQVVKKKNFSSEIKNFFSILERKGFKINIALHPKNNSKNLLDIYGNRKFFKNKTFDLISRSCGVISHDSTAISFAVKAKRPIIFLTTNELQNTVFGDRIVAHAKFFNSLPINISNKNIKDNEIWFPKIPMKIFTKYEKKFLKHEKFYGYKNFKKDFLKLVI